MVLAHNLTPFERASSAPIKVLGLGLNSGWVGVQLFFVLSGFLISGILLDTREKPRYFTSFYARRTLRIFPLYYFVLAVAFVVLPAVGAMPSGMAATSSNQVWLWTYVVNWTEPHGGGVTGFPHFWSLAVEEQFYLFWPLLARFTVPSRLLTLSFVLATSSIVSRVLMLRFGATTEAVYHYTFCRMDALVLGAALAAAFRVPAWRAVLMARTRLLFLSGVGLLALLFVATKGLPRTTLLMQTAGYTLLSIAFTLLVGAVVSDHVRGRGVLSRAFSGAWLRALGKYSYAIYVVHQPLNLFIGKPWLAAHGQQDPSVLVGLGYVVGVSAASFVMAALSFHGMEKHFLRLKRHFLPGSASAVSS